MLGLGSGFPVGSSSPWKRHCSYSRNLGDDESFLNVVTFFTMRSVADAVPTE
jgi:hypothetical protein